MARRGWEQRQVAGSSASSANTAADLLSSSSDGTSGLVIRSANAVADMHWCIDNLCKIRADVGDSKHSDWSDYWEAGYKKTKPWGNNTFVPKRLVLGTNSMWVPFYHSGPDVPDDREIHLTLESPPKSSDACCTPLEMNIFSGMTTEDSQPS